MFSKKSVMLYKVISKKSRSTNTEEKKKKNTQSKMRPKRVVTLPALPAVQQGSSLSCGGQSAAGTGLKIGIITKYSSIMDATRFHLQGSQMILC